MSSAPSQYVYRTYIRTTPAQLWQAIRRLRKALTPYTYDRAIRTVRGAGYRFSPGFTGRRSSMATPLAC